MSEYIQEYYTFWRCASCPKCKKSNWLYDSHSQRHYPDIRSGCKCWSCGHIFWVGEKEEFEIRYGDKLEDYEMATVMNDFVDYQEGQEKPF